MSKRKQYQLGFIANSRRIKGVLGLGATSEISSTTMSTWPESSWKNIRNNTENLLGAFFQALGRKQHNSTNNR